MLDTTVYRTVVNRPVRDGDRRAGTTGTRYAAGRGGLAHPDESVHALCVRCLDETHPSILSLRSLCRRRCATSAKGRGGPNVCNCSIDEGRPLGTGLQEQVPNHLRRLWSKAMVVSAEGKGPGRTGSGDRQKEDRKGTTDDVSKA